MSDAKEITDLKEQIMDLQSRLAFQDQAINEFNDVMRDQQRQIDQLQARLKMLDDKLFDLEESASVSPADEKPPHY